MVKKVENAVFTPLGDNILIEKDVIGDEEKTTPGGLLIPDAARKQPDTATVLAVGSDVDDIPVGCTIVIGRFCGTDVVVDDEEFIVIKRDDILGIVQ